MREFFKPWRRKVGVVTLGLACVFTTGWLHSAQTLEFIEFSSGVKLIVSANGEFGWLAGSNTARALNPGQWICWPYSEGSLINAGLWYPEQRARFWHIHYSLIVIPLTLLSAWLLLCKPRPAKLASPALPPEPERA